MNNPIWKSLIAQYLLGIIYMTGLGIWNDEALLSALVGCLAFLLPNTFQTIRLQKQSENKNAVQWLGVAYRSEFAKWLMTCMIFVLAFSADYAWNPIVLFAGYIVLQVSCWFLPLILKGK